MTNFKATWATGSTLEAVAHTDKLVVWTNGSARGATVDARELRDWLLEEYPLEDEKSEPEPVVLPGDIVKITKKTKWRSTTGSKPEGLEGVIDFDLPAYGVVVDEYPDIAVDHVCVRVFGSDDYGPDAASLEVLPKTVKLQHRPTTERNTA